MENDRNYLKNTQLKVKKPFTDVGPQGKRVTDQILFIYITEHIAVFLSVVF